MTKKEYKCPKVTVDAIIPRPDNKIILIKRKNPPYGWALPGGFVDYGESVEDAVRREVQEETNLVVSWAEQQKCYSEPVRDARCHAVSIAFVCGAEGTPKAQDDAKEIGEFSIFDLPELVFDHKEIIEDYITDRRLPEPGEYTEEEVRETFLKHISSLVSYWGSDHVGNKSTEERLGGLAFSFLSTLDGCSTDCPGFIVAPSTHETDKDYHKDHGEKFYPQNHNSDIRCDIGGGLHEYYSSRRKGS